MLDRIFLKKSAKDDDGGTFARVMERCALCHIIRAGLSMILGWDPVYTLDYVCRKIGIDDRSLYFAIFEKKNFENFSAWIFFWFPSKNRR